MKVFVKNLPRLHLLYLLQRRKTTLTIFVAESGITTYEDLIGRCERMGVVAPTEDEFMAIRTTGRVNSPQEGIVVVEPPESVERPKKAKRQKKNDDEQTPVVLPPLLHVDHEYEARIDKALADRDHGTRKKGDFVDVLQTEHDDNT